MPSISDPLPERVDDRPRSEHLDEKDRHHCCDAPGCDGTRLGHDLAAEFPEANARFDAAMDRLRGPREDRVMPERLRVDGLGSEADRG